MIKRIEFGKELLNKLQKNKIEIQHPAYCNTLKEQQEFFRKYDYNFAAQDAPIAIDYYLSLQEENTSGINYICNYMQKLILENEFCKYFEISKINFLLRGYDEEYEQSLINIFECVLINSVGCVLCKKSIFDLSITDLERDFLKIRLKDISKYEWDNLLYEVIENLLLQLKITDIKIKEHCLCSARKNLAVIKNALGNDCLKSIFVSFQEKLPFSVCFE